MIDEAAVRTILNTIIDPCSQVAGVAAGLSEMGLVRRVEVEQTTEGYRVKVTIGVTEPGCLMGYPFATEARKRLEALPEVSLVQVELDQAHDWLPEDMAAEYRERLEAYRVQRRRLFNLQPAYQPK